MLALSELQMPNEVALLTHGSANIVITTAVVIAVS
jgi:hypothetical protein